MDTTATVARRAPWNKGKLVGQKAPLKVKDVWAIRVRLEIQVRTRDVALFDLGMPTKPKSDADFRESGRERRTRGRFPATSCLRAL